MGITPNNIPTDITGRTMINYSGKPGDYEYISMSDVLNGSIDPRIFDDSIVFVGAYDPEMMDDFNVPNGGSSQMYGVEIHANIFQSYLQGRFALNGNAYLLGLILALLQCSCISFSASSRPGSLLSSSSLLSAQRSHSSYGSTTTDIRTA
jgi:adenylate cyclase